MDKGIEGDWKQHARMGWERLQKYISSSKQLKSEYIGNNKDNNAMWVKSKSALHTHVTNDSVVQKNLRTIRNVKKTPLYHIHRKHDVKYWYEEPGVGMGRKKATDIRDVWDFPGIVRFLTEMKPSASDCSDCFS